MKYIKLFEGFFDRDFGSRLWTETDDWVEWQEIVESETPEELEPEEISEIIQTWAIELFDDGHRYFEDAKFLCDSDRKSVV